MLRRRLATADHALIAEIDRRGLVGRLVMPSMSALLQGVLRLSPNEAKNRVHAAKECGPRAALTGEPLPSLRPYLSAAQSAGQVSPEHTRAILGALEELPTTVSFEDQMLAEKHLVEAAATLRPREVGLLGERLLAHLHPDGTLAAAAAASPPRLRPSSQRRRKLHRHGSSDTCLRCAVTCLADPAGGAATQR
jgi:hypothetical protein